MSRTAEIRLSLVIPCHNEAGNIGPLLQEVADVFRDHPVAMEVLCVDDASTDDSAAEVRGVASRHNFVRLLRHRARCGKSAAVWTGFRHAQGEWVATMDGDGQNDPADLLRLWRRVEDQPPPRDLWLYNGRRNRRNDGRVKWFTSRAGNLIRRTLLNDGTADTGSGLKMFRRVALERLPYFDNMHRYYPALVKRAGGRVEQVLINDRPRRHGQSKYGFFDRLAVAFFDVVGVSWLMRRANFPELDSDPI